MLLVFFLTLLMNDDHDEMIMIKMEHYRRKGKYMIDYMMMYDKFPETDGMF